MTGRFMFLEDSHLETLYARTTGPVAFVDESYWDARAQGRGRSFYSMSAVSFDTDRLDLIRNVLTEIAQGRYWHTTEEFKAGGWPRIADMTEYVAEQTTWSVLTVEASIGAGGIGEARQTCLAALAREVTRGEGPNAVRLLVADRSRDIAVNREDRHTLARLRSTRLIDPNVTIYHARMRDEPVLWCADAVSWSAYRSLAVDDARWIAPLRPVLSVIDARTGQRLEMKQPQAAVATPGAQPTTGPTRGGQSAVASGASLPRVRDEHPGVGGYLPGTGVLDDLTRQSRELRRRLGPAGAENTPAGLAARARRMREQRQETERSGPGEPGPDTPGRQL